MSFRCLSECELVSLCVSVFVNVFRYDRETVSESGMPRNLSLVYNMVA